MPSHSLPVASIPRKSFHTKVKILAFPDPANTMPTLPGFSPDHTQSHTATIDPTAKKPCTIEEMATPIAPARIFFASLPLSQLKSVPPPMPRTHAPAKSLMHHSPQILLLKKPEIPVKTHPTIKMPGIAILLFRYPNHFSFGFQPENPEPRSFQPPPVPPSPPVSAGPLSQSQSRLSDSEPSRSSLNRKTPFSICIPFPFSASLSPKALLLTPKPDTSEAMV